MRVEAKQEGFVTIIQSTPPLYKPNIVMTSLYFTTKREALERIVSYYRFKVASYKNKVEGKRSAQRLLETAEAELSRS